ncbi:MULTISPECIES: hypothetical protein [unclassified Knoellia]|uniref:hypothetical protein n=1 Tax=Knoellia altitudinis TaxID=3404795 RepID=UPI003610DC60
MGEKGNITSDELATAASGGLGAVIAGTGTTVTAVFEDASGTLKDKVIDKGADAGIAAAEERWRRNHPNGEGSDGALGPDSASGEAKSPS